MTHDEFLAETNRRLYLALYSPDIQVLNALRAVVELHKPSSTEWDTTLRCSKCRYSDGDLFPYPCTTIQAIEEELK